MLRRGSKVKTRDGNAVTHGRAPEKPEAIGVVADYYRTPDNKLTPPYLVTFTDGRSGWYDETEVERATLKSSARKHSQRQKAR